MDENEEVQINHAIEPIGQWFLSDGSILTFKTVALKATRLAGQYDEYGNPKYGVSFSTQVLTKSPYQLLDPRLKLAE